MKVKVYVIDFEISSRLKKWGLRIGVPVAALLAGGVAFAGLPGGYKDGQALTQAALDANFTYLQNEITMPNFGARTPSAFRATMSTGLPTTSGVYAPVSFDTVLYDLAGEYSESNGYFVPKAAGVYLVTCSYEVFPLSPSGTDDEVAIYQNGTEIADSGGNNSTVTTLFNAVAIVQASSGDTFQCKVVQISGVSQTISTSFPDRNAFSAARLY